MKTVIDKMADLANTHPHLKTMNLSSATNTNINTQDEDQTILPQKLQMFTLAELKSITSDIILLEVKPQNVPTAICGDGCATNMPLVYQKQVMARSHNFQNVPPMLQQVQ